MADKECPARDLIQLGPHIGERERLFVRHTPSHEIQAGVVRLAKDGDPIPEGSTFAHLRRKEGSVYEVEEVYSRPASSDPVKGPAKVTSEAYRSNWDNIFGSSTVGQA